MEDKHNKLKKEFWANDERPTEEMVYKIHEVRTEEKGILVTMERKVNDMILMYTNVNGQISRCLN